MGMEAVVPWVPPLGTLVDARRGDQQPSVEQPQQGEPPAEIQAITPGKEEVNGEDPVNHNEEKGKDASRVSDLETGLQDLAEAKTGGEGGDGPDVKEEIASNREPVEMPEAGRNMNGQGASTLGPVDPDCSRLDERVVDPQPSVEQPQEEGPPAEIQDITPEKEEVSGEDPVNPDEEKEKDASEDAVLETDLRELAVAKTGGQGGDGPDVKEEIASNREPVEMPEAGRNMNGQGASTLGPVDPDCSRLDERVVDPQPSVEQPQEEGPPAEIQDITPEKEEVSGEDPVNPDEEKEKDASEDAVLETDLRELAVAKTGGQGGDGPDVKGEIASNREPVEMPEAGRNMNGQGASTLGPVDPDCSRLDERVVDPQPSVEQPQEEGPPAEIQDITPEKEEVSGEDPVNPDEEKEKDASEDAVLETDLRELAVAKTGGQGGDGPDVKEEIASNREPVEMPEAGEGQPFP
ncbi:translation initiation factor IF-2-like isoform X5 [Cervus elaphus]|uniref:translation initiation factor IF-2-like isoform X5 n=1 Tax=Cervus elaphus TaxID=9860 RepID=UPI001CC2E77D|nr:translation initiation factor IF-2-like isoform X5 [Cervus elaphus]